MAPAIARHFAARQVFVEYVHLTDSYVQGVHRLPGGCLVLSFMRTKKYSGQLKKRR